MSDYHETTLWRTAFGSRANDKDKNEREYFRDAYERFRERVIPLVGRIATELPALTLHDITHLDALWETASEIAGAKYPLNPAEGFVLGGAILLHDAAMCAAAYEHGLNDIKSTPEWRDCAVQLLRASNMEPTEPLISSPPGSLFDQVLFSVLRDRHASQAEHLATMAWPVPGQPSATLTLIENADLRSHYGELIGQIAHSHHWNIASLTDNLQREISAIALPTVSVPSKWSVDCLKIACLLRTADAAHIDARRAPRQYRLFVKPTGVSVEHWKFQERLGKARLIEESETLRYTSGKKFDLSDADAWWLCFDTIQMIDEELSASDRLLNAADIKRFAAKSVLDAATPSLLSRHIQTKGWVPVDARVRISDVTSIVKRFGGTQLYGNDRMVALRELIQNAADAIRARRKLEHNPHYGKITVTLREEGGSAWLDVEDDGVGMAEHVLTGALLDFGQSFWRSSDFRREWPGLAGSGFEPAGKFGIGFFSVFMLGDQIVVTSRRFDQDVKKACSLEFRNGLSLRPILTPAKSSACTTHGGTKVSVKLNAESYREGNVLAKPRYGDPVPAELTRIVAWLGPTLDVSISVQNKDEPPRDVVIANDWRQIEPKQLVARTRFDGEEGFEEVHLSRIRPIMDDSGNIVGRAAIYIDRAMGDGYSSICVGGLRATSDSDIIGLMLGKTDIASRTNATVLASDAALSLWADDQAKLFEGLNLNQYEMFLGARRVALYGGNVQDLRWIIASGKSVSPNEFGETLSTMDELAFRETGIAAHEADDVTYGQLLQGFVLIDGLAELEDLTFDFYASRTLRNGGSMMFQEGDKSLDSISRGDLTRIFLDLVLKHWKCPITLNMEKRAVGHVGERVISRDVYVLRRGQVAA